MWLLLLLLLLFWLLSFIKNLNDRKQYLERRIQSNQANIKDLLDSAWGSSSVEYRKL